MTTGFKNIINLTLLLCLILNLQIAYSANAENLEYSGKVQIEISGSKVITNSISSCIHKELRSLGDVAIVDNQPQWTILILAMALESQDGRVNGVALSTVIATRYNNVLLSPLFNPQYENIGTGLTSGLIEDISQSLVIGPPNDLEKLCKSIIADFDTNYLEESRKVFAKVKKRMEDEK